jgi:hypothetical protein
MYTGYTLYIQEEYKVVGLSTLCIRERWFIGSRSNNQTDEEGLERRIVEGRIRDGGIWEEKLEREGFEGIILCFSLT